jgi:alpha-L-fucosidase 2
MTHTERPNGPSAARRHHVIWDSPSAGPFGSMPLGNGDISLNAWVEASGDLCFYIGKTDSWDENGRLLKLGLIRVSLEPNPFAPGGPFRQELRVASGDMIVTGAVTIRLWVDARPRRASTPGERSARSCRPWK